MEQNDKVKKIIAGLAVAHFIEALLARRMARKRGKSPALYFFLGLFFGFFPLLKLRKIKPEEDAD